MNENKFEWNIRKTSKGKVILKGYNFDAEEFIDSIDIEDYFSEDIDYLCDDSYDEDLSYSEMREWATDEIRAKLIENPFNGLFDIYLEEIGDVNLDFTNYGITNISDEAFLGCSNIKSIKFPETLEYIGESVFSDCDKLSEITLPSSLKKIKGNTFHNYQGTVKVNLSEYTPYIFDQDAMDLLFFSNISSLKEGKIQEWIDYFKANMDIYYDRILNESDSTFMNFLLANKCLSLEDISRLLELTSKNNKIDISSILLEYQHNTFSDEERTAFNVSNITELRKFFRTVNKNEDELYISKFTSDKVISEIEIPESLGDRKVVEIGPEAFSVEQNGLESVDIKVRKGIKKVIIPQTVSSICERAFKGCSGLEEVILSSSITEIKESTFENCTNLKTIVIPSSVKKIANNAFKDCFCLTEILS